MTVLPNDFTKLAQFSQTIFKEETESEANEDVVIL